MGLLSRSEGGRLGDGPKWPDVCEVAVSATFVSLPDLRSLLLVRDERDEVAFASNQERDLDGFALLSERTEF